MALAGWPADVELVQIPNPLDGSVQHAIFRRARTPDRPLAVVLHTWSASVHTVDNSLVEAAIGRDWNYIYPDFRGPNDHPDACCSRFVISDVEAAITFALDHTDARSDRVHLVGASGGGYTALCYLMRSPRPVSFVGAWVPITDLLAWHHESVGRQTGYDRDIRLCTSGDPDLLDPGEALRRSPIALPPSQLLPSTTTRLYAGIHDGHVGAVPISHSLHFYNRVLDDLGAPEEAFISADTVAKLVDARTAPRLEGTGVTLGDRAVLYRRRYGPIGVDVFDGGHEILDDVALDEAAGAP